MYEVLQTKLFSKWLKKLKDNIAKIAIVRRLGRLENGNFGDSKFVGDSGFELRIDVGKGDRIYFTNKEKEIVILLVGGEKSTQDEDIKKAKEMAKEV